MDQAREEPASKLTVSHGHLRQSAAWSTHFLRQSLCSQPHRRRSHVQAQHEHPKPRWPRGQLIRCNEFRGPRRARSDDAGPFAKLTPLPHDRIKHLRGQGVAMTLDTNTLVLNIALYNSVHSIVQQVTGNVAGRTEETHRNKAAVPDRFTDRRCSEHYNSLFTS